MSTSAEVRSTLVHALRLDLVGPDPDDRDHEREILPQAPSKWYLTGFLVPFEAPASARADDDDTGDLIDLMHTGSGDDENAPEPASARRSFFPSSMGISVLVDDQTPSLEAHVTWGDYVPKLEEAKGDATEEEVEERKALWRPWERSPGRSMVRLGLDRSRVAVLLPDSGGLEIALSVRPVKAGSGVPDGTRAVSVFLVNRRKPAADVRRDVAYAFQAALRLCSPRPFVPRPDIHAQADDDWDQKVADLQYRNTFEFAVGHNVSATAIADGEGRCLDAVTEWIPSAEVEKVVPGQVQGVVLEMETLAGFKTDRELIAALENLPSNYEKWIARQRLPEEDPRRGVAQALLSRARIARDRIATGIALLADADVRYAFQVANRAIATAIRQRACHGTDKDPAKVDAPKWHPFQLAFILLNLMGSADPGSTERDLVDLLFFPTGGGKTEAYLGLAAFTLVLRRLKHPGIASAGVSVLMRYTLRLLTLDQLGRAATLICALELERQKDPRKLGDWPFEIGLWVGLAATPNKMGKRGDGDSFSARARTIAFQNDDQRKPSPIPIENCPWCGRKFTKDSFTLVPDANEPRDLRIRCTGRHCKFTRDRLLPIIAVDEPIYRRLPCFLITTVDKFAGLPWEGRAGTLFGNVERHDTAGFYGACDVGYGNPLPVPSLPPPDLVIQDELHLISGPLGTMVGLYETAIEALSTRKLGETEIHPKIVASTATVRRAERQIQGLFARMHVDIFPPPGPDLRDSYFARTVLSSERNARLYVGVAAQARNPKVILLRTYLALLGAAQKAWSAEGKGRNEKNAADPYMTLLGYFNSLRELGGSRRIIEDEVNARLRIYSARKREGEATGSFADREIADLPLELTSRVSTNEVADAKRRLSLPFREQEHVDVAIATNMISVGLDITRLGLIVVLGQPKTAAEYIQATSRVGRDDTLPGLVVTILNVHRPRDRSHYERFSAWHRSFYRAVEATSVTPFSPRAVDRGVAAVTVALARHGCRGMTAPPHASEIVRLRSALDFVTDSLADRAGRHDPTLLGSDAQALRNKVWKRARALLDTWESIAIEKEHDSAGLQYQREVGRLPPLLRDPLDPELPKLPKPARLFKAPRSLRDVERTVNLWVRNPDGFDVEEDPT